MRSKLNAKYQAESKKKGVVFDSNLEPLSVVELLKLRNDLIAALDKVNLALTSKQP